MSIDEMRGYCKSISSFQLRVEVRLKNGYETFSGKINGAEVDSDRFQLVTDDQEVKSVRYAWVAHITNA